MGTPNQPPAPGTAVGGPQFGSATSTDDNSSNTPAAPGDAATPVTPSQPAPPPQVQQVDPAGPPGGGTLEAPVTPTWTAKMAQVYNNALTRSGVNAPKHAAGDPYTSTNPSGGPSGGYGQYGGFPGGSAYGSGSQLYGNQNMGGMASGSAPGMVGISAPGASWDQSQQYTGPTAAQFFQPVTNLARYTPIGLAARAISSLMQGDQRPTSAYDTPDATQAQSPGWWNREDKNPDNG